MRTSRLLFAIAICLLSDATLAVSVVLESADVGPTGQPTAGLMLSNVAWGAWRFDLDQRLEVRQIGGHLTTLSGTLFGALVSVNPWAKSSLPRMPSSTPKSG
jgi:hypothetical protein